jgi:hypothetical protein
MLSPTANLVLILVVGGGVLFFALKFGTIGGGGAGAERTKNPFNYWLGVGTTAVGVIFAAVMLVLMMFGVVHP